jgi:dolichol kinase
MILRLIVACFFVGSTIFFAEAARMNKWVSGERARKIIHIFVGIWAAWLPLWLGWKSIIVLGVLLFVGVFVAERLKFVKSIRSVSRSTVGEYLFPVTMIILAVLFKNNIIFAASMLQLGLSDGMAAVIGTRYGKKTTFKIMGNKKSKHGTATFFVLSTAIYLWALWALHPGVAFSDLGAMVISFVLAVSLSGVITIAELTGKKGVDNITVPLLTAVSLTLLS